MGLAVECLSSHVAGHVDPMALSMCEGAWTGRCPRISLYCWVEALAWGGGFHWRFVGSITQQGCVGASEDGFWEVVLVGACGVHLWCSKAHQMHCSSCLVCFHVLRVHVSSHGVHCQVAQVCTCHHHVWVCILHMSCLLCTLVSTQMIINKLNSVAWIINLDKKLLISFDIKNYDLHCFWKVREESRLMGRSKDVHWNHLGCPQRQISPRPSKMWWWTKV